MSVTFHDPEARLEKIAGLIERYRQGEFGEAVFTASLRSLVKPLEVKALVIRNRAAFQNSKPYKRGDVR